MASSVISYKGKGFWVSDSLLEVFLYYMDQPIKANLDKHKVDKDFEWLRKMQDDNQIFIQGFSPGAIGFDFEDILNDPRKKEVFRGILAEIREVFLNKAEEISIEELNTIEALKDEEAVLWESPLKTNSLLKLAERIMLIVEGKLTTHPVDTSTADFY